MCFFRVSNVCVCVCVVCSCAPLPSWFSYFIISCRIISFRLLLLLVLPFCATALFAPFVFAHSVSVFHACIFVLWLCEAYSVLVGWPAFARASHPPRENQFAHSDFSIFISTLQQSSTTNLHCEIIHSRRWWRRTTSSEFSIPFGWWVFALRCVYARKPACYTIPIHHFQALISLLCAQSAHTRSRINQICRGGQFRWLILLFSHFLSRRFSIPKWTTTTNK